ncbi:hypothetical protein N752_27270 [Desulforamulus aquiferis]|nr:hypothetical protein N752_27270 [Desulforamulus aquiferis]
MTTGEAVIRETVQPGAILTRVAASHLRSVPFNTPQTGVLLRNSEPWLIIQYKDIFQRLKPMRIPILAYFKK